jgi:hypothetical protein
MKGFAKKGHEMTLFTSRFTGCQLNENINGIDTVREGNKYAVYKEAKNYLKAYKHHYDIIVDEINTVLFLVPKVVRE